MQISPYNYGKLIFHQSHQDNLIGNGESFESDAEATGFPHEKKKNFIHLMSYTKINLKWIINLHVKAKP